MKKTNRHSKFSALMLWLFTISLSIPAAADLTQRTFSDGNTCDNISVANQPGTAIDESVYFEWGLISVTAIIENIDPDGPEAALNIGGAIPNDTSGNIDDSQEIQDIINFARDCDYATYFPVGEYIVSDTIYAMQRVTVHETTEKWEHKRLKANVLIGQKIYDASGNLTDQKPTLKLKVPSGNTTFNDPNNSKPVLWVWSQRRDKINDPVDSSDAVPTDPNATMPHKDPSEPDVSAEQASLSFNQVVKGIDVDLSDTNDNSGAVGIRHAGSQGSTLENVYVNATGAYAGFYNVPGQGGGTYKIKVEGGKHAIYGNDQARYPMIAGAEFINQTDSSILWAGQSNLTLVGFIINTNSTQPSSALTLQNGGNKDFGRAITLIDGLFESNSLSTAIDNTQDRNLYLKDVYFKGFTTLINADSGVGLSAVSGAEWTMSPEYSFTATHGTNNNSKALIDGNVENLGYEYGAGDAIAKDLEEIASSVGKTSIRDYLIEPHVWPDDFASFDSPGITNASDYCGDPEPSDWTQCLKDALADSAVTKLFLPKNRYVIKDTLTIPAHKHLFGVSKNLTFIQAVEATNWPSANTDAPVVESVNDRNASSAISSLSIERHRDNPGFTALSWKAGRHSIVKDVSARPEPWIKNSEITNNTEHHTYHVSANGGGRWYGMSAEWNDMGISTHHTNYRHLLIENTTEPVWLYAVNYERSRAHDNGTPQPQGEITNAKNVFIYYLKGEVYDLKPGEETYNPVIDINTSENVMVFGYSGNAKPDGNTIIDVKFDDCNHTGSSAQHTTFANVMQSHTTNEFNTISETCGTQPPTQVNGISPLSLYKRNDATLLRYEANTETIEVQVAASADDAAEYRDHFDPVNLTGQSLSLGKPGMSAGKYIGVRFDGVNIPEGARIVDAYIQFTADDDSDDPVDFKVQAENTGDAAQFQSTYYDLSSRTLTESILWQSPEWVDNDRRWAQQTNNLASIVQTVVNRQDWASGNAMAFQIMGDQDRRIAESYDGNSAEAATLYITYSKTSFNSGTWSFEENNATAVGDSSGLGNDGSFNGAPTWQAGKVGTGLHFTGGGERVLINDDESLDISDQITIMGWFKPEQKTTQYAVRKGHQGVSDGYELSFLSSGKVIVRFNQKTSGSTYRLESSNTYPTNGDWIHVAGRFDGETIELYINGQLDTSLPASGMKIGKNDDALSIGAQHNGALPFKGVIDEISIYNVALSSDQIDGHYSSTTNNSTLTGNWSFEENDIIVSGDSSSNDNDADWNGSPTVVDGKAGKALNFSGGDDRLLATDSPSLDISNQITIMGWFKPEQLATQYAIRKGHQGISDGYELSFLSSGAVIVRFNQKTSGATYRLESSTTYPTNGDWIHVAGTFDGETIALYINGQPNTSMSASGMAIGLNDTPLSIGAQHNGALPFFGDIDEVSIHNTAMSAGEILDVYNNQL